MAAQVLHQASVDTSVKSDPRIDRIRHRYQTGPATLSVERARYFTESWKKTERSGLDRALRVALAMKNVFEKMTIYVDRDDRIAGHWTEGFLGIPIPIERGEYNQVFASELTRKDMIMSRVRSGIRGFSYMFRKGTLLDFVRNQRISRAGGHAPLNMDFKTMSERGINPFQIEESDRKELLYKLLPYWKDKNLADVLTLKLNDSGLYSREMYDFSMALTGNTSRQVFLLNTAASIATIQGHVIIDFDRVLKLGLRGMRAEIERKRSKADTKEKDFFESLAIALDGISIFSRRLAQKIAAQRDATSDTKRKAILDGMYQRCNRVPEEPPQTFAEAVQALWTIKTAVEVAHPINLHCFGRLDQSLFPFYKADIEAGRITRLDAQRLLEELYLKIMSHNLRPESNILSNFYHRFLGSMPITLAGVKPDGSDGTNELTYVFIDAAHQCQAITNVAVRIHPETPDELLEKIATYFKEGTSSFSLFNDETHVPALERRGFALEHARDYATMGCVEATCPGRTGSMSANALLLTRVLDMTLRDGDSAMMAGTLRDVGLKTGDPNRFSTFEELLEAFFKQAEYSIEKIVQGSNLRDQVHAEYLPAPFISAFMDGCLDSGRDVTKGGATYDLSGISLINSIANLIDSLCVIRGLVFDQQKFTLRELLSAIDDDFNGHDKIHEAIRNFREKWGNGDPAADALARRVMQDLVDMVHKHRTFKDAPFVTYVISMITHTIDGRLSIASPDGRRAGTPYAASCNPYNVERSGPTGALRSVSSLPFKDVMGSAVNMKFHPTAVGNTEEARKKWVSLLRTYFDLGGAQLQPTCVSAETLREAQQDPDRHRDLMVKVGGYSTYFVDLGREIQDEVIARTEHR